MSWGRKAKDPGCPVVVVGPRTSGFCVSGFGVVVDVGGAEFPVGFGSAANLSARLGKW